MTRATSIEAWHALKASGQLKGKQAEVLHAVIVFGPGTSGEIIAKMDPVRFRNVNSVRCRFSELAARGLIREVTVRACKITGRNGVVWEQTDRAKPLDLKKGAKPGASAKQWKDLAAKMLDLIEQELGEGRGGFAERFEDLAGK